MAKLLGDTHNVSILFLGNSLIGEAVDHHLSSELLKELLKKEVTIEKVVPDGSDLPVWYFILKNDFIKHGYRPHFVIIGFAWDNALCDQNKINELYLSEISSCFGDVPMLYHFGLKKVEQIIGFMAGKFSSV